MTDGQLLAVLGTGVSVTLMAGYLVGRSVLRQKMRAVAIGRTEDRQSSIRKVQPSPAGARMASNPRPGAGFGRVHLGIIHHADPTFDELALRAWFAETVEEALTTRTSSRLAEGALASLQAGPRGRIGATQVQLERVRVHGVFADDLWANVELGFGALIESQDGEISWQEDRWRLRRRAGEDWEVVTISDSRRLLQLPEPTHLPMGPPQGALLPAVDLDWPALKDGHPEVMQDARQLLTCLLEGEAPMAPGLARALSLDAQRSARQLEVESIEAVEALRANTDAAHTYVEVRLEVRLRAWTSVRPPSPSVHYAAVTMAKAADGEWFAVDLAWVEPPLDS